MFTQILALCAKAGLAKVGTVAVDGTKMAAAASLDANYSKETIEKQVAELLAAAESTDAEEDALYGDEHRGEQLPEELRDRSNRRKRLADAKAGLEAEEQAAEADYQARVAQREATEKATGKKLRGRKPKSPGEKIRDKGKTAKANTTDPDSRIMPTKNGWVQGFNAQAVATEDQIIVAAELTQETGDIAQLEPMITATDRELSAAGVTDEVGVVLGDAGYCSEEVLVSLPEGGPDYYLAARNMRHGASRVGTRGPLPRDASLVERMDRKVSRKAGRAVYDKRKSIIEPVFGQIKTCQDIDSFARRGLGQAQAEWKLITATHNLRKLYHRRSALAPRPAVTP